MGALMNTLLEAIDTPAALRKLTRAQLHEVAQELRQFLLTSVAQTGGHLASNLGTVELAIALHHVFDTPRDRLVWDVGHQCYPHKILTGRSGAMRTIRQMGGISGFPCRSESEYDTFGTAHSSTSVSAMLGMAHAVRLRGEKHYCIAVIGDGAMSAGIAFEALNNAALQQNMRLLVILNDNGMSISPSVGALENYLKNMIAEQGSGSRLSGLRNDYHACPPALVPLSDPSAALTATTASQPTTWFEQFGFAYHGPIDGHDLYSLIPALEQLRAHSQPQFLHVVTRKGYGYPPAEVDPVLYHGPSRFDPAVGIVASGAAKPTYSQIFGDWLCDEAARDSRVVAITPAMREGSGLVTFQRQFPDRYFDVGIAEQHAITFAGGLATEGMRPVVAIYSTFLQRGYDQLIHDIAIQNLPVVFAIDRAGIVGTDGPTHMGAFDIAFLRCIPNLVLMAPSDEAECRQMLHTALMYRGPAAVRYPRGAGPGATPDAVMESLSLGKARVQRQGSRIALLAFGPVLAACKVVGNRLDATVVDMRFIKPLDHALLRQLAQSHELLVTVEEGCIAGGAGSACLESLAQSGLVVPVLQLGLADQFIAHGDPVKLLAAYGLDAAGIESSISRFLQRQTELS